MLTNILLGLILILLAVLVYLSLRKQGGQARQMETVLSNAWVSLGIDEKVGRLEAYANDIRQDYRSLEKLLRAPTARGALGEVGLEAILADQLPPNVYGIRRRIMNGKTPDAYVRSTVGQI
jgi:DNA anti-recombination protein RmuC